MHHLALALAYIGAAVSAAAVLPQLTRTIRHPELTGVSPASWGLTSLACTTWLIYGLRADVLPQVPGNVLIIAGAVALVLLVPSARSRSQRAAFLGTIAMILVPVSLVIPPVAVGYLAFVISLFSLTPQLVDSYATWRAGVESGVSLGTWTVRFATSVCWLAYALIAKDVPVLIASVMGLSTVVAVYAMESSARQTAGRRHAEALAST